MSGFHPSSILEETFPVTSADVDFTKTLKPSSLINFLIQAAWRHAEMLGLGMDFLHENKLVWVLSRVQLEVYYRPNWNDVVKVSTWPKGIHRLFYLRDMEFYNGSNDCIAKATTQWLIIDMANKRPKLYDAENPIFNQNQDKHAIDCLNPSIDMPEGRPSNFEFIPRYSDIDLNQHLTTTSYVDWMFDTFSIEELEKLKFTELTLNFMREIKYGDSVSVERYYNDTDRSYNFKFRSQRNEIECFKGKVRFK